MDVRCYSEGVEKHEGHGPKWCVCDRPRRPQRPLLAEWASLSSSLHPHISPSSTPSSPLYPLPLPRLGLRRPRHRHPPHPRSHPRTPYSIIMGMRYRQYLAGARIYGCSTCKTHLATIHSMISRVSILAIRPVRCRRLTSPFRHSTGSMAGLTCSMECKYFRTSFTAIQAHDALQCECRRGRAQRSPDDHGQPHRQGHLLLQMRDNTRMEICEHQ